MGGEECLCRQLRSQAVVATPLLVAVDDGIYQVYTKYTQPYVLRVALHIALLVASSSCPTFKHPRPILGGTVQRNWSIYAVV